MFSQLCLMDDPIRLLNKIYFINSSDNKISYRISLNVACFTEIGLFCYNTGHKLTKHLDQQVTTWRCSPEKSWEIHLLLGTLKKALPKDHLVRNNAVSRISVSVQQTTFQSASVPVFTMILRCPHLVQVTLNTRLLTKSVIALSSVCLPMPVQISGIMTRMTL